MFQLLRGTCCVDLDAAIVEVSCIASDSESSGTVLYEVAEPYALNSAINEISPGDHRVAFLHALILRP